MLARPTNGVSMGVRHTITAAEETATELLIDFQVDYPIVASIMVTTTGDVFVPLVDAVITYPANGQVHIANGGATFVLTEDDVIHVVAQRAYDES